GVFGVGTGQVQPRPLLRLALEGGHRRLEELDRVPVFLFGQVLLRPPQRLHGGRGIHGGRGSGGRDGRRRTRGRGGRRGGGPRAAAGQIALVGAAAARVAQDLVRLAQPDEHRLQL